MLNVQHTQWQVFLFHTGVYKESECRGRNEQVFLLLYCFLPKKRSTKDCGVPLPNLPSAPYRPPPAVEKKPVVVGRPLLSLGRPLNSCMPSSLSSQLTLVCLQWIQLEPYSWVTSRGGMWGVWEGRSLPDATSEETGSALVLPNACIHMWGNVWEEENSEAQEDQ